MRAPEPGGGVGDAARTPAHGGPFSMQRNRPAYALLAACVIAVGLLWRSGLVPLPAPLAKYGGDALWALVVFLGFGFVYPRLSTTRLALLAVCFAWAIEFSQLYHADWIDGLRATLPGRLILGSTFNSPDLLAYLAGIALGVLAECAWCVRCAIAQSRRDDR